MKNYIFFTLLCLAFTTGCEDTTTPKKQNVSIQKIIKPCDGYGLSLEEAVQKEEEPCSVFISDEDGFPIELNSMLNLRKLTLHNCSIDSFPDYFIRNSKLKTLMISGTNVLPYRINLLNDLEILHLTKNAIPNMRDKICSMQNLKALHLIDNKENSDSLFSCIGRLKKLETFHLGASNIQKLPEEFGNLTELREIEIVMTELTTIKDHLQKMNNLKKLHLEDNKLSAKEISFLKEKYEDIDLVIKQRSDR